MFDGAKVQLFWDISKFLGQKIFQKTVSDVNDMVCEVTMQRCGKYQVFAKNHENYKYFIDFLPKTCIFESFFVTLHANLCKCERKSTKSI